MNSLISEMFATKRATFEKYLPVLLAVAIAWLFARGLRKLFWMAFGMYWIFHWSGGAHWMH